MVLFSMDVFIRVRILELNKYLFILFVLNASLVVLNVICFVQNLDSLFLSETKYL